MASDPAGTLEPTKAKLTSAASELRDLVTPALAVLVQKLEMARHRTMVDDRLDRSPPSIRIKVEPWRAPFDEGAHSPGAVLEILREEGEDRSIVAQLWLDPLSETPSERVRVEAGPAHRGWIDQLFFDFVAKALRAV